jgi:2-amino-4-hydroxy-6-hydroxymethyldihydropteridine diphosphokinase
MIFLNIGSNLDSVEGDRLFNIKKTLELIRLENIQIIKISSVYETPSYPNKNYPRYLNIGLEIKSSFSPENLIKRFNKIENKLKRTRGKKNEPRTCDIDLIDYKRRILNTKDLIIPHPRAHLRNFVLFPIKEISPRWIHPVLNKKIDLLIKNLGFKSRNEITRIKEHVISD